MTNALGNNTDLYKISAVYLKVLNLKPIYQSRRATVIPFAMFLSSASNKDEIYSFLVEKLNVLMSEGIVLTGSKFTFNIQFCCSDNLGANEITGLVKSFKASHYCRFCTMSSIETNEIFEEDPLLLRKPNSHIEMYQDFIEIKQIDKTILHNLAVKNPFLIHGLNGFDCQTYNFLSCISHDLFETIVPQLLETTLGRVHRDRVSQLNLDALADIISNFKLNSVDSSNRFNISKKFLARLVKAEHWLKLLFSL